MQSQAAEIIIIALLAFTVIREILFQVQIQRMINKLMSRNYNDYVFSNQVTKKLPQGNGEGLIKEDLNLPEDLAPIGSFGLN